MNQNSLEHTQEKLALKVEIATENDLPAIRKLRMFAAQDERDAYFLATTPDEEEKKSDAELREEMFENGFVVLAQDGSEGIGMCCAKKDAEEEGVWYLGSAYIKPEFRVKRDEAVGLRILGAILEKIIREGATIVNFLVRKENRQMVKVAQLAGAKIVGETGSGLGHEMELDLTDPEVITRLTDIFKRG